MNQIVDRKIDRSERLDSLQTVRALAFLGVFTSHLGRTSLGAWGVSVFLILSGFVMFYSYEHRKLDSSLKGCVKFSFDKIKKVYPLHIFTMLMAVVLAVEPSIRDVPHKVRILLNIDVALNATLLQAWEPYRFFSLNAVSWYLSVCSFLYAIFPHLIKMLRKISRKKALFLAISVYILQVLVAALCSYINGHFTVPDAFLKWTTYISPIFRLGDFVIGCCIAIIYMEFRSNIKKWLFTIFEVGVFFMTAFVQYLYVNDIGPGGLAGFKHTLLYTPVSALLVFLFAINRGGVSKLLTCKPLVYLGDISAYTFLIHLIFIWYIETFWERLFGREVGILEMVIVASVGTIVMAIIYKWVMNRLKKE